MARAAVLLVTVGSRYRRDDDAPRRLGEAVARRRWSWLEVRHLDEPLELVDLTVAPARLVVLDAARGLGEVGRLAVLEGAAVSLAHPPSTHALDLAQVLELRRQRSAGEELPLLVGIEGTDFSRGEGLSPALEGAMADAAEALATLLRRFAAPGATPP